MKTKDVIIENRPSFRNESGVVVHVRPIALDDMNMIEDNLKADYRKRGKPIDPPEIEVEVAGGGKAKRPLTKTTLVTPDEAETARRAELWAAHQAALDELSTEYGQIMLEYVLDGVDEPLPEDPSWQTKFKRWKYVIPEDPFELELFYKKHVLLKTPGDFIHAQQEVMLISSSGTLDRKRIEAQMDAFFRDIQARAAKMDITGTEGKAPEKSLATRRPTHRTRRSVRVEKATE